MWTREHMDDARRALNRKYERLKKLDREYGFRATERGGGLALSHDSEDTHEYVDHYIDFFKECWQFKDYVKNSKLSGKVKTAVEAGLKAYPMNLCGDLAERTKHARLNNPNRNPSTQIVKGTLIDWKPEASLKIPLEVESDGQRYPIDDLVADCMGFWDQHLP